MSFNQFFGIPGFGSGYGSSSYGSGCGSSSYGSDYGSSYGSGYASSSYGTPSYTSRSSRSTSRNSGSINSIGQYINRPIANRHGRNGSYYGNGRHSSSTMGIYGGSFGRQPSRGGLFGGGGGIMSGWFRPKADRNLLHRGRPIDIGRRAIRNAAAQPEPRRGNLNDYRFPFHDTY